MIYFKKWFTLVELVVVITIVSILSTIWFVAYTDYLKTVRDSNRAQQLSSIQDWLELYAVKNQLPFPNNPINITYWASNIWIQWSLNETILSFIQYNEWGTDPLSGEYFTYYITNDRKFSQLLGFFEESDSLSQAWYPAYASTDYESSHPKVFGTKLGIILQADTNIPIQRLEDISNLWVLDLSTNTGSYVAYKSQTDIITSENGKMISLIPNQSCLRILEMWNSFWNNIYTISPDWNSQFQVYCDMEIDGWWWTIVVNNDNSDDESVDPSDCKPRLSWYPDHTCGSISESSDFVINASRIQFTDLVFAAYENTFDNIKTYQYLKWMDSQEIPATETYNYPNESSSRDNLLAQYEDKTMLECPSWNDTPILISLQNWLGLFEPHTAFSAGWNYQTWELSFIDIGNSTSHNSYGLDDYQDGHGCADIWEDKNFRWSSAYIMIR